MKFTVQKRAAVLGFTTTATASNYPHIGLYNPAGSTYILRVTKIVCDYHAGGNAIVARYNTALATSLASYNNPKNIDGTNTVVGTAAYELFTSQLIDHILYSSNTAASVRNPLLEGTDEPIYLQAGQGVLVTDNATGRSLGITMHWEW